MGTAGPARSVEKGGGTSAKDKAPWGSISRRRIVDAALRAAKGEGFERMTIRGLASELGVAPMSLYRHIRDKDDLLDEVVDRLLRRAWRPPADTGDWKRWIIDAAESLRHLLVKEPAALYVYLRHPVVSPAAVARMESMMRVLLAAGLDEGAARHAYATVQTYTVGFAALEAARGGPVPAGADPGDLAAQLASYTTPRQFADGLQYLLEGIERRHLRPRGQPG